jgi:hypothetical protein
MALKIFRRNGPLNQIQSGIVAKDGEFVYASDGLPYSGKYYIQNGVAYAGENLSINEVPIPLDQTPDNQFATLISTVGYATAAYAMAKQNIELIKQTSEKLIPTKPVQKQSTSLEPRTGMCSFTQKSNDPNKVIKQFNSSNDSLLLSALKKDPLYKVVDIDFSALNIQQQLAEAEKTIPGITTFVNL